MQKKTNVASRKTVALVLGSGSSRGWAHIGAIEALEEARITTSIGIMQERITRINLAVDPPDVLVQPRLKNLKMLDFDQVENVIKEGYISVKEKIEDIKILLA